MLLNQIIISFCEYSSVGETVHVICEAESVPAAKTFSWTFNGTPLGSSEPASHSIIETQHGTSVRNCSITSFCQALKMKYALFNTAPLTQKVFNTFNFLSHLQVELFLHKGRKINWTWIRSTVIINEAQEVHFGDYKCTVENEIGTSQSTISLVEKGKA